MNDTAWKIIFEPRAEKELFKLDASIRRKIQQFLRKNIATSLDPRRFGKALKGNLSPFWCYHVGDYRLLCVLEDQECIVAVVQVGHRRDIYH